MATQATASRSSRSAASANRNEVLAATPIHDFSTLIQTAGNRLPNRYVIYGREGWGKTSLAAHMPNPLFLQGRGETGLETLIDAGQLPETPHSPELQSWEDVMRFLEWVRKDEKSNYKTLVIDAANGIERLMHEMVCHRDFNDDWGDHGFMGYQRGYDVALADWRLFLSLLDSIRLERKMTIVILSHAKVTTFKNPDGPDFDRYQPDVNPKTWALTHKWADCVLFGNFEAVLEQVQENRKTGTKKGKILAQNRILCTQNSGAYDAKNRLGLEAEIEMGDSPAQAWANLKSAIVAARKKPVASATAEGGVQ